MPRRSPPGHRTAMEEALGHEDTETLHAHAAALGIPPDRWHRVPALARPWEAVAVHRLAERIRSGSEVSQDRALHLAAGRLGLDGETIRTRTRRMFGHARGL